MKILAFESSAGPASAALLEDGHLLAQYYQNSGLTHSKTLLPLADALFQNTGICKQDIDLLAVANGPGSFTGVRIGVATVKGLAFGLSKPCAGVSTLLAMAHNLLFTERTICTVMDARVHQVYQALFAVKDGEIVRKSPDRAVSAEELSVELLQKGGQYILVGDGAKLCYNIFSEKGIDVVLPPENLLYQSAYGVARAAWAAKTAVCSGDELVPSYLRASQAERERKKKLEARVSK